jgi:ubiquinone/menaquinone biosynthesis C-methylase UbiE
MNTVLPLYQQGAIYDRLFDHIGDAQFYIQLLSRYGGDCLEICCGTGRVLLELAVAGLTCSGLDYAPSMLEEARRKASERGLQVDLQSGDMRDFDLGRTFANILIIGNSFTHLNTLDDIQRHLKSVRRHMRGGSKFIVDMFNPRLDLLLKAERYHAMDFIDPIDNQPVIVYEESRYDSAAQMKFNRWFYEKNGTIESAGDLPMRIFFPQELDALLTLNGLRIVEKFGDYDGSAFADGSPHQIVICELAES